MVLAAYPEQLHLGALITLRLYFPAAFLVLFHLQKINLMLAQQLRNCLGRDAHKAPYISSSFIL